MTDTSNPTSAVDRIRERQKQELDFVTTIGKERQKVETLENTIATHWDRAATAMQGLAALGWNAKQIAEVVNLDTRRVSSLLKATPNRNGKATTNRNAKP